MKKIIKVDGIITNIKGRNTKIKNPRARYFRIPSWANISYKCGNHYVTSKNRVSVSTYYNNGNHVNVWYIEGRPYTVFKNPVTAWFSGLFS